jgi:membrane protein DedA with SNARE-associated domain
MRVTLPLEADDETSPLIRRTFVGLVVLRGILAIIAIPLAPALQRDHVALLVFLRPTKDVFLFAGFQLSEAHTTVPAVVAAALPLLLGGVWATFGLGRAYADHFDGDEELPGVLARVLPKERVQALEELLEQKGPRVVFLGRLAAFPSTVMGAAAGASGMSWKRFVLADGAGALVSLGLALLLGSLLQETYEAAGPWLTAIGVAVLVVLAVIAGRWLKAGPRPSGRDAAS